MKVTVIGCGLRTPLLIHGLDRSSLPVDELVLYDIDPNRAQLMTALGKAVATHSSMRIRPAATLDDAIDGCKFAISSIRVGDIAARARDERIIMEHGFAGQETTGPGGLAMALRTVPVAIEHAQMVLERADKNAWIINFTNPAGLITQAISTETGARVVGICDTPAELFFRISIALGAPLEDVECEYFGLNHLGWVRRVKLRGEDVTQQLLSDDDKLRSLYPADLFPPDLIRALALIPTEYLFFYYSRATAHRNQLAAGATRGEEILVLNQRLLGQLYNEVGRGDVQTAVRTYANYLNRRNASYLQLEAAAGSALTQADVDWDPFQAVTGYHRIAVEAMRSLSGAAPQQLVLNVANRGAIDDLSTEDVIEINCATDAHGPTPMKIGPLPRAVQGLVTSVKAYERLALQAAKRGSLSLATHALFTNPIVGDWQAAHETLKALKTSDPLHLGAYN